MSRSKWKGVFLDKKILNLITFKKKHFYISSRSSTISSFFLNKLVFINTGNNFKKLLITRDHIGYKFGEFATTRQHKKKPLKKKR